MVDESQSTPFTIVSANPDGSWSESTSPTPVQAQRPDGSWAPVDTRLTATKAGDLVPANVPDAVSFSAGAGTQVASMTTAGQKTTWLWPTKLPKPTVSGATATYQITRTEQLVLTATPSGFSEDIVLSARPSSKAAASFSLPMQTGTGTLATRAVPGKDTAPGTAGLKLTTAHGKAAWWAAAPMAYDATATALDASAGTGSTTGSTAAQDPAAGEHVSPLGVSVTPGTGTHTRLTLNADWAWLTAPTTKYPIEIDPTYTSTTNADTYVENEYPNTVGSTAPRLEVGDNAGTYVARTLLRFSRTAVQDLSGKDVRSATLSLWDYSANSCTSAAINAYRITGSWDSTTATWNNQPAVASTSTASFSPAYGYSSACPQGSSTWNVTSMVAGWASGAYVNQGIELAANTETNVASWRAYRSYEAYTNGTVDVSKVPSLNITYNTAPATPTTPKVTPVTTFTPKGSTTGSLYTSTTTPTVSTTVADPDGGTVKATISFYTSKTGTPVASCTSPMVASGSTASCAIPAASALGNGVYYVRATASDGTDVSAAASGWTQVTVAAGRPQPPTVTCTNQTNGTWAATAPLSNVACVITETQGGYIAPGKIAYTIDGTTTTVAIPQPTGTSPATVNVSVGKNIGGHAVSAYAISPVGNPSSTTTDAFGYGTLGLTLPATSPMTTTSGTIQVQAYGPAQASGAPTAYVEWRLAGSGLDATHGWNKATTTLTATPAGNGGLSFAGVWDTSNLSGVDARTPQLLEVQVCADYAAGTECTWGGAAGNAKTGAAATDVLHVAHAFGNDFPTTAVPDGGAGGQAALWTGEWQTSATDATLSAGTTSLSISRSASSYAGQSMDPAGRVFGTGWTADLSGPDSGYAGEQVIDDTQSQGVLILDDGAGDDMVFAPSSDGTPTGTPVPAQRTGADLTAGTWLPMDAATAQAGVVANVSGSGSDTKLTLTDPDGTTTLFTVQTAPDTGVKAVFHAQSVTQPGDGSATSYAYDGSGRVARILAPVPAGLAAGTCPGVDSDATLPAGCRAIALHYATTTTADAGIPGDYAGQVSSIDLLVGTGTGANASSDTTTVATYAYDTTGRLTSVTDPRDHLTTAYTYTTGVNEQNPVIASITPPGLAPIDYTYDTSGRLTQVTRQRDSADSPAGTADLATIAYNLPAADIGDGAANTTLSGTGLPDLSNGAVAAWDQPTGPTYAAAVFGPDHPMSLNGSGDLDPTSLSADGWTYASLSYADAEGREVNDASYGAGRWLISDTEYDSLGTPVRQLSTGDIAAIQDGTFYPQDAGTLTVYNTEVDGTDASGNPTVLLPADTEATDTYTTARWVQLAGADGGTTAWVRPHTHTAYDQGAPNAGSGTGINPATGQNYALPTTVTAGAADPDTLDTTPGAVEPADLQVDSITKTGYDHAVPVGTGSPLGNGESADVNAGWDQGLASSTTKVMDNTVTGGTSGAAPITSATLYDAAGDVIATSQPGTVAAGGTADAGTRQSIYYTAGTDSSIGDASTTGAAGTTGSTPDIAACDNHPAWAGLLCQTRFAGTTDAGASLVTTTYSYNDLGDVTSTVETSGATTRTTATTYDAADRQATSATSVTGLSSSAPVPATSYAYDPATGLATTTTPASGQGGAITTGYDTWGRVHTYTTSGGVTTTSYDAAGDTATVVTPDGVSTSYTYDGGSGKDAAGNTERRGLPTSVTATATSGPNAGAAVTDTGAYDASGNLVAQNLPGGISIASAYDTAGQLTSRVYSGDVTTTNADGSTTTTPAQAWVGWSQTYDPESRVIDSWTPDGAALSGDTTGAAATGYADAYSYDPAGRLVQVVDQTRPAGSGGLDADGTDPGTGTTPTGASCVIRQYGFSADGNRTNLTTIPTAADGTCQSATTSGDTGVVTTATSYDTHHSDRVAAGSGYVYDDLGRVTTLPQAATPEGAAYAATLAAGGSAAAPGNLTLGYYDTDTIHTETQNGQTTTDNLDATGRVLTQTTGPTGGATTSTITDGYSGSSDSPGWETTTTGTTSATESYVSGLGGDLAATLATAGGKAVAQLAVNDPHGDCVSQITLPASGDAGGLDDWTTTDEYGNPVGTAATKAGATATNPGGTTATDGTGGEGYGWNGAKTRPTQTTGLILMGARLYNPATGMFTAVDPVYGGNTTPYTYPQDPINGYDLNGQWGWHSVWHAVTTVAKVAWNTCGYVPGVVGTVCSAAHVAVDLYHHHYSAAFGDSLGLAGGYLGDAIGDHIAENVGRRLYGYAGRHLEPSIFHGASVMHVASHYVYHSPARAVGSVLGDRYGRNYMLL